MTPDERLYAVYELLADAVTDEHGLGGSVYHEAEAFGWKLFMSVSSFGDLHFRIYQNEGPYYGWEWTGGRAEPPRWHPYTVSTPEWLPIWAAELAEEAHWKDKLPERGKDVTPNA